MKRAALFIMLSASVLLAQQQLPIDIAAEPHHRLLLENDNVRVFAVTIPPREATELTRHEHNFLVVTFQDNEIASWAEGEAGSLRTASGRTTFISISADGRVQCATT